jgi:Flp pilus assembly pilin Flp
MRTRITRRITELLQRHEGQDLLEYAMLVALIAVFAVGAVTTVGNVVHTAFWQVIAASNV